MSQPTLTRNTYSPPKPQSKPPAPSNQEPWGYGFLEAYTTFSMIGSIVLGMTACGLVLAVVFTGNFLWLAAVGGTIGTSVGLLASAAFFSVFLDVARRLRKP